MKSRRGNRGGGGQEEGSDRGISGKGGQRVRERGREERTEVKKGGEGREGMEEGRRGKGRREGRRKKERRSEEERRGM